MPTSGGQILVRGIDGRTLCVRVPHSSFSGLELKSLLECKVGIPSAAQRLVAGIEVADETVLFADEAGQFPSCSLLLRLVGGKGGFGSLLRGAATKAGQKKTDNFDACRDMSGRRLRHVNAEKQLREWKAEAKDRDLEKAGEDFIKKLAKEKKENVAAQADLHRLREQSAQAMEDVTSAVESGLLEARRQAALGKRKVEEDTSPQKRNKLMSMLEEFDDEDQEDEDENGGGEVVNGEDSGDGAGPSSVSEDNCRKDSSDGEATCSEPTSGPGSSSNTDDASDASGRVGLGLGSKSEQVAATASLKVDNLEGDCKDVAEDAAEALAKPVDLKDFQSASELETLGMEKLKAELQQRGLKCGGSLAERAGRLFLLKLTPIEKLDKKHFAKPIHGKKAAGS